MKPELRKINSNRLLFIYMLLAITAILYSILTFGRTVVHSDSATAIMLARAQIRSGQLFPKNWCYANGDIWVISLNLFVMPFTYIIKDQSLARMLGSVFALSILCAFMIFMSRKAFEDQSYILSIPFFLLMTYGRLDWAVPYPGVYDMTLYQAGYISSCILIVAGILLMYNAYNNRDKAGAYIALGVFIIIVSMSGVRYLAEIVIPLLITIMLMFFFGQDDNGTGEGRIWKTFAALLCVVISAVVGTIIYKVIESGHYMAINQANTVDGLFFSESIQACRQNLKMVFFNYFNNLGYIGGLPLGSLKGIRDIISMLFGIVIFLVCPIGQGIEFKKAPRGVRFFYVFGMSHNLVMLLIGVLFGKYMTRYYLTSVFIFEIIAAVYLLEKFQSLNEGLKYSMVVCFGFVILLYSISITVDSSGWRDKLNEKKAFCDELVSKGLKKGYATFWNAYTNEIYSDERIKFGAVEDSLMFQQWWLTEYTVFTEPIDDRTFLIVDESEREIADRTIYWLYGQPEESFTIGDKDVYVWDYDIACNMLNGLKDNRLSCNEFWLGDNAEIMYEDPAQRRIVIHHDGVIEARDLAFDKGEYMVEVAGHHISKICFAAGSGANGQWDDQITVTKGENTDEYVKVCIEIKEDMDGIVFSFSNSGDEDFIVNEVRVNKIPRGFSDDRRDRDGQI